VVADSRTRGWVGDGPDRDAAGDDDNNDDDTNGDEFNDTRHGDDRSDDNAIADDNRHDPHVHRGDNAGPSRDAEHTDHALRGHDDFDAVAESGPGDTDGADDVRGDGPCRRQGSSDAG
jgi:hypothetical protein